MLKKLLAAAIVAAIVPVSAHAYEGKITFKGGCQISNSGQCILGVTGLEGSTRIYSAKSADGSFGPVTKTFTAPGKKRIVNSVNNVCFYAKKTNGARTRAICLTK